MDRIDSGALHVFTFKEGLLSPLAHDLRLSMRRFAVELDGDQVTGRFWPATLSVDGVMRRGQLDTDGLKDHHKREIQGNITQKILRTDKNPQALFEGQREATGDGRWKVSGTLELAGRKAPLEMDVRLEGGAFKGKVELRQTRWGVKPFKAVGGTIKLKDKLFVEFSFDAP